MDRLHSGSTDRRTAENTQAGDEAGKDRAATPTTCSAGSGVRHERIMSRRRRKTLIFGHAICRRERKDKQLWHRRSYRPIARQVAMAKRIARHQGRRPQERAALKKRLLRKWMGK